jgi:alpha-mannosidase
MIVHMIGNAHLDPVWLWPWQVGVDEALATFGSAADRCDEYPDFVFTRGEAWLYQQVERIDPQLFDRVRRHVENGQWHVTGGQYIQPDLNLSTEMGLHRQIVHGQRYFRDRFGVSPKVGYNVDSFGHPATLPDVLASHGYEGYVFHRPGAHQVELPSQTFRWRGVGGGEVIGFRISPAYVTFADDLYGQIMLSVEAADPDLGHTMCFYGVGNHGGGPTKANIEYVLEHAHAFEGLELRFSTPQAFFDAVAPGRERLPLVSGELQRTFPGCYSVMHDIKQHQQRGEHLLDQCERLVERFAADETERRELHGRLDGAWEDLLFTEFHDILAGTSVPSAWGSVRAMQGRARITGEEIAVEVTRRWARRTLPSINEQQIVVVNPDKGAWEGLVETEPFLSFDIWRDRWLSDAEGQPIDFQLVQPEGYAHVERVVFPLSLAGGGFAQVLLRNDAPPSSGAPDTDLEASSRGISNGRLLARLDGSGIRQLVVDGRELLGENGIGLHLRHDRSDTWTFGTDRFVGLIDQVLRAGEWVVEESGPLRGRVRLDGRLGDSRVRWTLTLHRDEPRLHMRLEVDFNERFKLLQLPVHLAAPPAGRTDGLPGGQVSRGPGPTEWPVQGWSRVELADLQLALVTSDAYSLSQEGNVWQWTLLRSPKMAWGGGEPKTYAGRDRHTDQGPHTFDFVLRVGESLEAPVLHAAARQQMQPPLVFDRYEGMDRPPWGNNPPKAFWLGAEQRALADGRMSHLLDGEEIEAVPPLFPGTGKEGDEPA